MMRFYLINSRGYLEAGGGKSYRKGAPQFKLKEAIDKCIELNCNMQPVSKRHEKKTEKKPEQLYLIWCFKRDMYWSPNERGYTTMLELAGLYSLNQAVDICNKANIVSREEAMIPAPLEIKEQLYYIYDDNDDEYYLAPGDGYIKNKENAHKYTKKRAENLCLPPHCRLVKVDD